MKTLCFLFAILITFSVSGNDGSFYSNGNQLIPMYESKISVQKEILNIKKVGKHFLVDVHYEFYNPEAEKTLTVGFEAMSPQGDVTEKVPANKKHPYIYEFSVQMNGQALSYQNALVDTDVYYKDGKFKEYISQGEHDYPTTYVYHFQATFKPGLNTIVHHYKFEASTAVYTNYQFFYVLKAAGRWNGGTIKDFTLNIDVGDYQTLNMERSFFKTANEWKIIGAGKLKDLGTDQMQVFIRTGQLYFQKNDFKPSKDLWFANYYCCIYGESDQYIDTFNAAKHKLQFGINQQQPEIAVDEWSFRVMKNLPYARRGYVFKDEKLQAWFSKQEWYLPDPAYEADLNLLTEEEKKYLKTISLDKS